MMGSLIRGPVVVCGITVPRGVRRLLRAEGPGPWVRTALSAGDVGLGRAGSLVARRVPAGLSAVSGGCSAVPCPVGDFGQVGAGLGGPCVVAQPGAGGAAGCRWRSRGPVA